MSALDDVARSAFSLHEITARLVREVARRSGIDWRSVDPAASTRSFAIDSLEAVDLCADFEEWLGVSLSATVYFEHPTLEALAMHLFDRSATAAERRDVRVSRERWFPVTPAQEAQYRRAVVEGAGAESNCVAALQLSGPLDVERLRHSLSHIVARHEALRTEFRAFCDRILQRPHPEATLDFGVVDLRSLSGDREALAFTLAHELAAREIDVTKPPLMRARLIRLADDLHVFVLVAHHLVFDGASLSVLLRELSEHYNGAPERPASAQYFDLLSRNSEDQPLHLSYWTRELAQCPMVIDLPADHPRPERRACKGATEPIVIESPAAARVRALCAEVGVTPFMVFLSALYVVLFSESGQSDLTVYTAAANRAAPAARQVIGYFANVLALRGHLAADLSARQLLSNVRRTVIDALLHQAAPFELVLDALGRPPSRIPIPQVTFIMHENPLRDARLNGLRLQAFGDAAAGGLGVHNDTIDVDLALSLTEANEGFVGGLQYDAELFGRERICRLVDRLHRVLESITIDPSIHLGELRKP